MMTEEEIQIAADALTASAKLAHQDRKDRALEDLRKWAIETLVQSADVAAMLQPGWVVAPGTWTSWDGPGPIELARGGTRMTITPPRIFRLADDLVEYARTGKHPVPVEINEPA